MEPESALTADVVGVRGPQPRKNRLEHFMKRIAQKIFAALAICFAMAACISISAARNRFDCRRAGGYWSAGFAFCQAKMRDGGRECTRGSGCQGNVCLVDRKTAELLMDQPTPCTGRCPAFSPIGGTCPTYFCVGADELPPDEIQMISDQLGGRAPAWPRLYARCIN
jgi:hypothetical protein